jgi:deoxyribodipyrimidine photolyase
MDTAIVLFTRDLRLHDNPALHQARDRPRRVRDPDPWKLPAAQRQRLGYPSPIVELS